MRFETSRWLPAALACLLLSLVDAAAAQSYVWRDVVQLVTIGADGGVEVDDTRTLIATSGDFGEAFVCVKLAPGQNLTLLDGTGAVSSGPRATAYTQRCEDGTEGTEVVVRGDRRVKERRVRFVYRLEGTLDYRTDVVQWYWQILETDHPPVEGYDLTVRAPGANPAPYDAYVHRFANTELPKVDLSGDRSELRVTFAHVPSGSGVEVRYLMDPALFHAKGTRRGMEEFLLDESRIAKVQSRTRLMRSPWWALLPAAFVLPGIARAASAYRRHGREPRVEAMKYPFEPPSDLPPAAVTSILNQTASASQLGPGFHATIMDLMRRGFGRFVINPRNKNDFTIELDQAADTSALLPFEAQVLSYLRAAARGGADLKAKALKSYSQGHASGFMATWGKGVRGWLEGARGGPLTTAESRAASKQSLHRLLRASLVAFGLAFVVAGPARVLCIILGVVAFIGGLVAAGAVLAWRPEIAEEVQGWQGFKRTLTDYTRMKDAPLDFFGLWDVYYCYAAALGVAEQYLKALAKAAPLAGVDQSAMTSRAAWLSGGPSGGFSDMSSLGSSISSLSSALSSASASASSGGSSSGGGGGGGGGSSGGR